MAKFLDVQNVLDDVKQRLSKYFDNLFVDEIQDLSGHDFNFFKAISQANLNIVAVGDFFQHTFDTSRDGNVNATLHDDFERYKNQFSDMGLVVDMTTLDASYRCSPSVCDFISNKLGVRMRSNRKDSTNIYFVESQEKADEIFQDTNIVKLFYQEHVKYGCYSRNWGDCKGEDIYNTVCVVLNTTTLNKYRQETLDELAPSTKNKLYVACSRAKGDLYFVPGIFYPKNT
jgi:hypothetical protein